MLSTRASPAQGTDGATAPGSWSLTDFDLIGFIVAGLGLLWSAFAVVVIQPRFAKMYADFGQQALPPFTELCLRPWFPVLLALSLLPLPSAGVALGATRETRMALMVVTILLALIQPVLLLYGLTPPRFFFHGGAVK